MDGGNFYKNAAVRVTEITTKIIKMVQFQCLKKSLKVSGQVSF